MNELSLIDIELVGGASHEAAEACLTGAAAVGFAGSFLGPGGAAAGALGGCAIGLIARMLA